MAKRITQQTFDDVVKENIDEFAMEPQEAIDDAEKQFEAQGVDLGNIVKDYYIKQTSGDGSQQTHPVLEALQSLTELSDNQNPDFDKLKETLNKIKAECDIDLPHRCLAGSNNGFTILVKVLEKYNSIETKDILILTLKAMCALCNGQPDVMEYRNIIGQVNMLKKYECETAVLEEIIKLIGLTCVKHEKNKQAYVQLNIIPLLVGAMSQHQTSSTLIKEACFALRVLTFDDDIREVFGKGHEHAKMIVTEADALKTILGLCQDYISDHVVLGELFSTLGHLAVRNEFCQEIVDLGGLGLVLNTLVENAHRQSIVKQVFSVLRAIAGNDNVKVAIINEGGAQMIVDAMNKHLQNPQVCESGCAAFATISLRNPSHCAKIIEAEGLQVVVQAMKIHQKSASVQKQGCMALRNLVARTREYCEIILLLGAESLINQARSKHGKELEDEAKAALRDLGCKVELVERWKGEHGSLQQ